MSKKNSEKRTSHSETKSKFKTHVGHPQENSCIDVKSELIDRQDKKELKINGKRRAQSSYACRPKSSVPPTTRTTGRITSVNE